MQIIAKIWWEKLATPQIYHFCFDGLLFIVVSGSIIDGSGSVAGGSSIPCYFLFSVDITVFLAHALTRTRSNSSFCDHC